MNNKSIPSHFETDLQELISSLWSFKIFIVLVSICAMFFGLSYSFKLDKKYLATSIFVIEKSKATNDFSSNLGAIASLAGLSSQSDSNQDLLIERLESKEFVNSMSEKLGLMNDPFFNSYNPNYKEPYWLAIAKKVITLGSISEKVPPTKLEHETRVKRTIMKNYLSNISLESTPAGALKISVFHLNPNLAAEYANKIMESIRFLIEAEKTIASDQRLAYLSETLADALQEMEKTAKNLKNYTLKNSARAEENFISESLKLEDLRKERKDAEETAVILDVLSDIVKIGNPDKSTYSLLRENYPLIDDVRFRSILGMSETIEAWSWPELTTIKAVSETINDRIQRLSVQIADIENDASLYASSAGELAALTREAKIAEATYTVLIEQVKSQSLTAGFKPKTFKVFEYASPPQNASTPNKKMFLILGAVLGFFSSATVSIVFSFWRGVFYSKDSLISACGAEYVFQSKAIKRISKLSIPKIISDLKKRPNLESEKAEISLSDKQLVYTVNLNNRASSSENLAHLLATRSALSGKKVLIYNSSGKPLPENEGYKHITDGDLKLVKTTHGIDILLQFGESENTSFFTSSKFEKNITFLLKSYDQIFISPKKHEIIPALNKLKAFDPTVILLTKVKKTKRLDLLNLKKTYPIGIMFNE